MTHSYGEDGFGVTAWVGIVISLVCMCVFSSLHVNACFFVSVSVCVLMLACECSPVCAFVCMCLKVRGQS